jgi:hypothetical protein
MRETLILANIAVGWRFAYRPPQVIYVHNARSVNEAAAFWVALVGRHAAN